VQSVFLLEVNLAILMVKVGKVEPIEPDPDYTLSKHNTNCDGQPINKNYKISLTAQPNYASLKKKLHFCCFLPHFSAQVEE